MGVGRTEESPSGAPGALSAPAWGLRGRRRGSVAAPQAAPERERGGGEERKEARTSDQKITLLHTPTGSAARPIGRVGCRRGLAGGGGRSGASPSLSPRAEAILTRHHPGLTPLPGERPRCPHCACFTDPHRELSPTK